ncbi:MAG: N-acetylmuramoyl-L-alanine amidase, partial [Candidatus Sulfotelmatobacter sp.]
DRGLWGALLGLALLATPPANARVHHSDAWAREHFATAERMREALNGRPLADRTRHDYQRVVNAYRSVYLSAPASTKADPSVVAVAETLVEMGRRFDDNKILNEAIEQYKFLRREYPGSKYRFDGLFTIGEIYKDDLNDPEAARATFQDFLRHYPHNRLADGARQAIVELNQEAEAAKASDAQKPTEKAPSAKDAKNNKDGVIAEDIHGAGAASEKNESSEVRSGRLPRVTGIRHWSTPDYTRVAIDVESDVKFSSQRIASPARIFFDLRDTKLASTLVGKSFDVDDGFLKKVRVAQFAPGRTRIVLEVDNLSDYDAFLLPNPYRLIIDIHGKNGPKRRKEGADSSLTEVEGAVPPQTNSELDPASSETKAAVSPTALPETGNVVSMDSQVSAPAMASASEGSAIAKKPQTAVVKKVVDADDDDNENASVPGTAIAKRSVREAKKEVTSRNTVAARKLTDSDVDGESETSDSRVSEAGRSDLSGSRQRSNSRTIASGRPGSASDLDVREAKPTARGDRSLIRALGLKIGKIVIDPGHGGHDTGTIGPNGLEEKDLVLEVGRRLGKLLETRLGAEVVYTRKNDTFIPLETRTAIANQARADLFVSIHANSSHDPDARGVETYYLNFTSSPEALDVAARENAVSEKSIYELQDLVKKIALKEKIEESREFAGDVQASLHSGLAVKSPAIRDRGVKKAPFIVLIGANMPSILAEISFVSNPTDEHRLATSEYRERIAESLYRGIAKYVNGLSGVKVASKMDKAAGQ